MLKNQTVNHVSEHLSAIRPVYTPTRVYKVPPKVGVGSPKGVPG